MFTQPATGGGGFFKPAEHNGHLVLFTAVKSSSKRFDTLRNGEIDEFTVDFVDLDGSAILNEDIKVGHIGITNKLKVGTTNVLARVGTVDTGKGNPAWVLHNFDNADVARAQAWVESQKKNSFVQPIANQQTPATPNINGMSQADIQMLMAQLGATQVNPQF